MERNASMANEITLSQLESAVPAKARCSSSRHLKRAVTQCPQPEEEGACLMTRLQLGIPPALRVTVGVLCILLSIPSFRASAVGWVSNGVDSRVGGVALAALGCWAICGGVRGLLRARNTRAIR